MKITKKESPFIQSPLSTSNMMRNLFIALIPIIIWRCIDEKSIYLLLAVIVGGISSFAAEYFYSYFISKRRKRTDIIYDIKNNHSMIPGIFVVLVLPREIPIYIIIVGAILAAIAGKMILGGFGNNKFNPALVGVLLVTAIFKSELATSNNNPYEVYNNTISASVDALLCVLALFYLTITKTIKWKISECYIVTVLVMTTIIGLMNSNIEYGLFHILSGGILFGAVFMATDPVTTPVTGIGQIIFGVCLGIITVVLRFTSSYGEAVTFSILIMNLFVGVLDAIGYKAVKKMQLN